MTGNSGAACFAQTYDEARAKFLAAVDAAGLDFHSHAHPLLGRDGEALAMDVVREGARDAKSLLIVSSACHGVEGFCGSGVQVALLGDEAFRAAARAAGVAVLHVHALNPYGFSWWRRTTHENCDLNRNFHDFSQPLPANPGYEELAALIVPHDWPPSATVRAGIERYIADHGMAALQAAISGGQHTHPEGLFYGGVNPTWSNVTLRHVLREDARHARRLAWIDLHTGLGPSGHGERIFAGRNDAAEIARARKWWGEGEIKFYLDGDGEFPTICGTGTEDYFCGSYNFENQKTHQYQEFTTPYAGLPQVIRPDGLYQSQQRFGLYRWHIMDPIRFDKDLRVTIQALGWRSGGRYLPLQDDIASVAFWYQTEPHAPFPVLPERDVLEVK